MAFTYDYPRPAVTVDIITFAIKAEKVSLLLIERKNDPFKNQWAFPGGFVDIDEDLPVAASRELQEETGMEQQQLLQMGAFGKPDRDPRGRTITVVYATLIEEEAAVKAADDAGDAKWFPIDDLPALAFDHDMILQETFKKLYKDFRHNTAVLDLSANAKNQFVRIVENRIQG